MYIHDEEIGEDLSEDRFTVMVSDRKLYTSELFRSQFGCWHEK